jgi:hypothetical protein
MNNLPFRQVHLDFHTSEHIPGVGTRFDKRQFQKALKLGRVNSITVFAKCHHGWSYYPTKVGRRHPTLRRNLLGEQIAACHEIGVRAPIYYTVGWSALDAQEHPDWIAHTKDGRPTGMNVDATAKPGDRRPDFSWWHLFPARAYRQLILDQTREICEQFPVDGFFYDICFMADDRGPASQRDMRAMGLNPEDEADARRYQQHVWRTFQDETRQIILSRHPNATVFFNGGADLRGPQWHERQTHFELEDLPTTWGGYDKFPIRAKYFANTGKTYLAMSGKFHTAWGEFGGFKHPDAIRYEAAAMVAFGARCSFGDQLHPCGEMDLSTYRNLGAAYRYVEQIEEYGRDGQPCANLGLILCGSEPHDQGVATMLLETQTDFVVRRPGADLSGLDTVILTGGQCLTPEHATQLTDFVQGGGHLLVLGEGVLDAGKTRFLLEVGAAYRGPARYATDYTVAGASLRRGLVESPFYNYSAALRVKPTTGRVLATIHEPYFDRTYAKYCSHQNTPNQLQPAAHPAAWRQGRVVCLAHPVGELYYRHGARLHRDYFHNALRLLHRRPVIETRLPSAGRVNVLHQPAQRRYVAHLLYGPPLSRGRCLVIEDLVRLTDIPVTLRVPQRIRRVRLAPGEKPLSSRAKAGGCAVVVPELQTHQIVVFEY